MEEMDQLVPLVLKERREIPVVCQVKWVYLVRKEMLVKRVQQVSKDQSGPSGERGLKGERGPPGPTTGGVTYTRWGSDSCANVTGSEMLYSRRVTGTLYATNKEELGANYLCLPDDPEYILPFRDGIDGMYLLPYAICYNQGSNDHDPS